MPVQPRAEPSVPPAAGTGISIERRALELRGSGKSYATIARDLGLDSARLAHEAFTRGVRQRPADERATLRDAEGGRLDALADETRAKADLTPDQRSKRLRAIERLRRAMLTD